MTQVTAQSLEVQAQGIVDQAIAGGLLKPLLAAVLKKLIESGAAQQLLSDLLKKLMDSLLGGGTTPPANPPIA